MEKQIIVEDGLLEKIASGDHFAFEQLFNCNKEAIHALAYRLSGCSALAEDILQEIFFKLWKNRESLASIQNLPGYLRVTVQNMVYNELQKKSKERKYHHEFSENFHCENPLANDTIRYDQSLKEVVEKLPFKKRITYELSKRNGLKRKQVAAILNVSEETIKSNLQQAIKKISAFFKEKNVHLIILEMLLNCDLESVYYFP